MKQEKSFYAAFDHDYAKVVYSDWGDKNGDPIICIHGLTGNGHDFNALARYLVPLGYRILAIDIPGRGRSDFLSDPDSYNYKNYLSVINIMLVREGLDNPASVHWLGVSMGGLLGIWLAGLPNSPIKRLILNDIGPEVPEDDLRLISQYLKVTYEFKSFEDFLTQVKTSRSLSYGHLNDAQWREMAEGIQRQLPNGKYSYAFDPKISEMFDHQPIGELNQWPFWDNITIPTLILRGATSTIFPHSVAEKMLTRGPGDKGLTKLHVFNDCGHVPSLMTEEQLKVIKQWLMSEAAPA